MLGCVRMLVATRHEISFLYVFLDFQIIYQYSINRNVGVSELKREWLN